MPTDRTWLALAFAPVLPLACASIVLELATPSSSTQWFSALAGQASLPIDHFGDWLALVTVAFLQMMTCVGVLVWQTQHIRALEPERRKHVQRTVAVVCILGAAVLLASRLLDSASYQLTYDTIRTLMLDSSARVLGEAYLLGQSRLFFVTMVPFLFGVAVTALATGLAVGMYTQLPRNPKALSESFLAQALQQLKRSFNALAAVLVASTLLLSLYLQLPIGTLDAKSALALQNYALAMTLFWGATMTLTLFAIFLPTTIALHRSARDRFAGSGDDIGYAAWLESQGFGALKQQLTHVATALAPLMIGPLGSLFQSLSVG